MKWVLINKTDEVADTCEIASEVGVTGAKTYFRKRNTEDKGEHNAVFRTLYNSRERCLSDR